MNASKTVNLRWVEQSPETLAEAGLHAAARLRAQRGRSHLRSAGLHHHWLLSPFIKGNGALPCANATNDQPSAQPGLLLLFCAEDLLCRKPLIHFYQGLRWGEERTNPQHLISLGSHMGFKYTPLIFLSVSFGYFLPSPSLKRFWPFLPLKTLPLSWPTTPSL